MTHPERRPDAAARSYRGLSWWLSVRDCGKEHVSHTNRELLELELVKRVHDSCRWFARSCRGRRRGGAVFPKWFPACCVEDVDGKIVIGFRFHTNHPVKTASINSASSTVQRRCNVLRENVLVCCERDKD